MMKYYTDRQTSEVLNLSITIITKSYLYNFDPLKPHFYIVKLGLAGVYIIFLISAKKNIDCGYSLEPPRLVLSRNMKNIRVFIWKVFIIWWKNFQYISIGMFS